MGTSLRARAIHLSPRHATAVGSRAGRANWSSTSRRTPATKEEVRWRESMAALLFSSVMRLGIAWMTSILSSFLPTDVISASFPVSMRGNEEWREALSVNHVLKNTLSVVGSSRSWRMLRAERCRFLRRA